jgi:hypothetical protein
METVKSLRQSGYKIRVIHHRLHGKGDVEKFDWRGGILAKGGRTELFLISPEGIQVKAEAKCSPKDNYCRRTGVAICLGRALKELEYQERLQKIKPKTLGEIGATPVINLFNKKEFERLEEFCKSATPFSLQDILDAKKGLENLIKDEQFSKNAQRGLDAMKEMGEVIKKEVAEVFKDPSLIKDVKREGYFQ